MNNPFRPNALDYLQSIIAACAKLQEHPTYLGLHTAELKKIDDALDSVLDSINDEIDAHNARNAKDNDD